MNSIPQDQNTKQSLERQAACRQLYSEAKYIEGLRVVFAGPLVVFWAILIAIYPNLTVWAALWGIGFTLADSIVFLPLQRLRQHQAAKIQEFYDCEVLHLPWREMKVGSRPDVETIGAAAERYGKRKKDPQYTKFSNWYPVIVGRLPLHLARIVCQRTNNWWDANLRRNYATWVVVALGLLVCIVVVIGIGKGFTFQALILAVLNPLLPAFKVDISEFQENRRSANVSDHLKECSESLWNKALSGNHSTQELEAETRYLQDEIYDRRRGNPLIFQWIYNLKRESYEALAIRAAEAMVEEALNRGFGQNNP